MEKSKRQKKIDFSIYKKNQVNTHFYFLMDIAKQIILPTLSSPIMVLPTFILQGKEGEKR